MRAIAIYYDGAGGLGYWWKGKYYAAAQQGPVGPQGPPGAVVETDYLQMDGGNASSVYTSGTFRFDMGSAQ